MRQFIDKRQHRVLNYSTFIALGREIAANRKLPALFRTQIYLDDFCFSVSSPSCFSGGSYSTHPSKIVPVPAWVAYLIIFSVMLSYLALVAAAEFLRLLSHLGITINRIPLFREGPELSEYRHRHR